MLTRSALVAATPGASGYSLTSDADTGRRLCIAFERATTDASEQAMKALNKAAVDFVDRLKVRGFTPEQMIVALKGALRSGRRTEWSWFPSLDASSDWASTRTESTVYARLFSWCVEAYYAETKSTMRGCSDRESNRSAPIATWRSIL